VLPDVSVVSSDPLFSAPYHWLDWSGQCACGWPDRSISELVARNGPVQ